MLYRNFILHICPSTVTISNIAFLHPRLIDNYLYKNINNLLAKKRKMRQKSILVLDDDVDLVHMFQIALEIEGFTVVASTKPLQIFEYFKDNSNNFSLIIADLKMPHMNGIEFASKVREIDKEIRIWLVTGYTLPGIKGNPLFTLANIDKVIQKPIPLNKLVDMVKSTINQSINKQESYPIIH